MPASKVRMLQDHHLVGLLGGGFATPELYQGKLRVFSPGSQDFRVLGFRVDFRPLFCTGAASQKRPLFD